jgi:hypothetical protein
MTGASSGRAPLEEILLRPRSKSALSEMSAAARVTPACSHSWWVIGARAASWLARGTVDLTANEIRALASGFVCRSNAGSKMGLLDYRLLSGLALQ